MESLAPTLTLTIKLRFDLYQGKALYDSLKSYCKEESGELSDELSVWLIHFDQGIVIKTANKSYSSYRIALFELIVEGLNGTSISEQLSNLQELMIQECQRNIDEISIILPYKGLMPLMLCMFPALILLILNPILMEFMEALG